LKRIANITAIEFCEIYSLDYVSLKKYVQINETILQILTDIANKRMELTFEAEELFKKQMLEKTTRQSFEDIEG
jgi:CRP-like cAMP-binding protein